MPNRVANPSFEGERDPATGNVPNWTRSGSGSELPGGQPGEPSGGFEGGVPRTGTNSLDARSRVDPELPEQTDTIATSDPFALDHAEIFEASAYYMFWPGSGNGPQDQAGVFIDIDRGDGTFVRVATVLGADAVASTPAAPVWTRVVGAFRANGSTGRFRTGSLRRTDEWESFFFVDDVEVIDGMAAKRRDIKAATVTALGTISIANGFKTDVAEVTDERKAPRNIDAYPALQVVYAGEEKEPRELQRMRSRMELMVIAYARGVGADDVCDDLAADVEKKLTLQENGQFLGLAYVDDVRIARVDATEPTRAEHRDRRVWLIIVEIDYRYDRGSP